MKSQAESPVSSISSGWRGNSIHELSHLHVASRQTPTARESQVLALIAQGCSNKQIARKMDISDGTVKVYVKSLLSKLGLRSRLELAVWVHRTSPASATENDGEHDGSGYRGYEIEQHATRHGVFDLPSDIPAMVCRGYNDRDWSMEKVSEGCFALTGYLACGIKCDGWIKFNDLILPDYTDYVWNNVQSALLRHDTFKLWYAIRCADGSVKRVFEIGQGIYAKGGEVLAIESMISQWFCPPDDSSVVSS